MTYSLSNRQVSNWEDEISTSSLSEAEEKTIKASLEGNNSRKNTTLSEIYETVRSEVRRAIAVIQDNLQDAGGPFLPLVELEAASLPLVGVGLSTSQPSLYIVEDGIGTHNQSKTVLGVTLLYFKIKTTAIRRNTNATLVSKRLQMHPSWLNPMLLG
ncbi:hypothetical protein Tco_0314002 [Tanacetum coccineum]